MANDNRVLLLGDSLGFARSSHGQLFNQAWPVLLKEALPEFDIWQRCRPAATILDVRDEFSCFSHYCDQFCGFIIQVGITDCFPRPFPYWMQYFLRKYGPEKLRSWIGKRYPTLLKLRSKPWISKECYRMRLCEMLDEIVNRNPDAIVGIVVIADAGKGLVDRAANAQELVDEYNCVLKSVEKQYQGKGRVVVIDPYPESDCNDYLMADGHHLTLDGHVMVARAVVELIGRHQSEKVK